jgi:putative endonuclease
MLRGRQLIFIEVKARKHGLGENIVLCTQQQRITRAAQMFLAKNPQYNKYDVRFDLAVVKPYSLPMIIKNAW